MEKRKAAILTAGGLAPCLSSAVAGLIEHYSEIAPDAGILAYKFGYRGLLLNEKIEITPQIRQKAHVLHRYGGSPIGNSRVKLTNTGDCVKRGLVRDGDNPLRVAAERLASDGVTILHVIGGDDTNTAAADLAAYLDANGYRLTVVGLPKTIDNDVAPIRQTLGALTAAEVGARFFDHVSNEQSAAPKTLVIHEVMGRHCGWLTAATARAYIERTKCNDYIDGFMMNKELKSIDGLYLPETHFDMAGEAARLKDVMDRTGFVTLFVAEGACLDEIVADRQSAGEEIMRDAFGHIKLDTINPGSWFQKHFAKLLGAERSIVQKSGYYARSAPASARDLRLIQSMVDLAVDCGLNGVPGVIGHDEECGGRLRAIEFARIQGGKPFDLETPWFRKIMGGLGHGFRPA